MQRKLPSARDVLYHLGMSSWGVSLEHAGPKNVGESLQQTLPGELLQHLQQQTPLQQCCNLLL
jgi:hypothetical protein